MRLIDADALIKSTDKESVHMWQIALAPTVDAVEVVRCKDCKYYEETDGRIGTCLLTISGAQVDGFCAWGEIKNEIG